MIDDDDDEFLYGSSKDDVSDVMKQPVATSVPQPISLEQTRSATQGLVATLEEKAASTPSGTPEVAASANGAAEEEEAEGEGAGEGAGEDEEESDDDIEIIMEQPSRSLDLRHRPGTRPANVPQSTPTRALQQPQPSLTTEYTPRERGGVTKLSSTLQSLTVLPALSTPPGSMQKTVEGEHEEEAGPDTSTLPPATAPPSHPSINPELPGTLDGRSILEVDLSALADKAWRRPGSDISDWFNYGFDEISWEAYCYRRREIGEVASVLKSNVLNFAGMPEEQLTALPSEIRTMVMAGATAMMANGGAGPGGAGMMAPGGGMNMNGGAMMNQMMNMGAMMNPMMHEMGGVVGPGMGMNGEMGMGMGGAGMQMGGGQGMPAQGMGGGPGGGMMQDGSGQGGGMGGGQTGAQGTSEQQMGMGDGFGPGGPGAGQGMMGMGMGGDYAMQEQNAIGSQMGQQMYPGMEGSVTPVPAAPTPTRGVNAPVPGQFRGRAMQPGMGMRGRSGFAGRGRAMPVRPASPLPPNVPTGPRNKNKYKDIDGSAPAVDGLDYGGGGMKEGSRGTPDQDERSSRKRKNSPSMDEGRGSKRR